MNYAFMVHKDVGVPPAIAEPCRAACGQKNFSEERSVLMVFLQLLTYLSGAIFIVAFAYKLLKYFTPCPCM